MAALSIEFLEAQPCLGSIQGNFPAGLQGRQSNDHGTHEGPLLLRGFVIDERLNYGNPASTAGNEHRPVLVRRSADYTAGIESKIGQ